MKNRNLYIALLTGSFLATSAVSCKKDLLKTNPNNVTVDDYYKTAAELQLGANAMYSTMGSNNLMAREWYFIHDLRGDEMSSGGSQLEAHRGLMLNGQNDPTNGIITTIYQELYRLIHRANIVITKGPAITDNPALRDRLIGEAKFMRAWAYNELVTFWGGVPIYTEYVTSPTDFKARATVAEVYARILADADDAIAKLPGKSGYAAADRGRVTKAAANMLKGKALMQMGDYEGARTAFLAIPTTGADGYGLVPRYLDNFEEEAEFNNESIFEMVYFDRGDTQYSFSPGDGVTTAKSTVRTQEFNTTAWRNLIPSNKYLNEFERVATGALQNDPRYGFSVYQTGDTYNNGASVLTDGVQNGNTSVVNGVTIKTGWRKYQTLYKKGITAFTYGGVNTRVYRYAEVLLALAECENERPGGVAAVAIGYLNQVRARTSVAMNSYPTPQFPVSSKNEITKAIMHERMVELGGEEVRNTDILRWRKKGYYPSVVPEPISYFQANKFELLPLPSQEIDNNPLIKGNNPGY